MIIFILFVVVAAICFILGTVYGERIAWLSNIRQLIRDVRVKH